MPLPSTIVGRATPALEHEADRRWTMAHAAGIGDLSADYLDTQRPEGVVAHPLFVHCLEWQAVVALRRITLEPPLTPEEATRNVHAIHDMAVHRLVRPGERLRTTATVAGAETRAPGAYETVLLETVDASGAAVAITRMGGLLLGVAVEGPDHPDAAAPDLPPRPPAGTGPAVEDPIDVPAGAAHVYTECARIWNPIHTDVEVAAAAGLPGLILHGSATLAMGVSGALGAVGGDPRRVRRVACRFGGMVVMPTTLRLRVWSPVPVAGARGYEAVWFEVRTAEDGPAVRDGLVVLGPPA